MKSSWLFVLLLGLSPLQAAEPLELENLRNSYQTAVARALKPLSETYVAELQKLRDTYTRSANLEAANAVQKEIDLITTPTANSGSALGTQTTVLDTVAVIAANSSEGFKLGPVRKGDVITLSYVSGTWKNDGNIASDSPDRAVNERGEKTRLVIAEAADKGKPGSILRVVPAETQTTPFSYVVQTTRDNLVLRIHYGGNNPKAPGSVTYKVKIAR